MAKGTSASSLPEASDNGGALGAKLHRAHQAGTTRWRVRPIVRFAYHMLQVTQRRIRVTHHPIKSKYTPAAAHFAITQTIRQSQSRTAAATVVATAATTWARITSP